MYWNFVKKLVSEDFEDGVLKAMVMPSFPRMQFGRGRNYTIGN